MEDFSPKDDKLINFEQKIKGKSNLQKLKLWKTFLRKEKDKEKYICFLEKCLNSLIDAKDLKNDATFLNLWIEYTIALPSQAALKIFRILKHRKIGIANSMFYLVWAAQFLRSKKRKQAIKILKLGMDLKATPFNALKTRYKQLTKKSKKTKTLNEIYKELESSYSSEIDDILTKPIKENDILSNSKKSLSCEKYLDKNNPLTETPVPNSGKSKSKGKIFDKFQIWKNCLDWSISQNDKNFESLAKKCVDDFCPKITKNKDNFEQFSNLLKNYVSEIPPFYSKILLSLLQHQNAKNGCCNNKRDENNKKDVLNAKSISELCEELEDSYSSAIIDENLANTQNFDNEETFENNKENLTNRQNFDNEETFENNKENLTNRQNFGDKQNFDEKNIETFTESSGKSNNLDKTEKLNFNKNSIENVDTLSMPTKTLSYNIYNENSLIKTPIPKKLFEAKFGKNKIKFGQNSDTFVIKRNQFLQSTKIAKKKKIFEKSNN
ncbi:protein kinase [Bonamia ostreae]|uniref:Protein kinase n=1 Tax=Bonamia ostreae TaxID=126728 RepID=A0ABV2ALG7_9EUKA